MNDNDQNHIGHDLEISSNNTNHNATIIYDHDQFGFTQKLTVI